MFELAAKAGVKLRGVSILTSATPRPPVAFATRWGVVFLNDGLLRDLSRREVDAIVCHELSHLRPSKRSGLAVPYMLVVASVLGAHWVPNFVDFIPALLLAAYFLVKAWRRAGERAADLDSVRWSGDPEAMITGLARVSYANGMPLEWAAPVSWMMGHPPTIDRIRAIGRAGRLTNSRVAELLEESTARSGGSLRGGPCRIDTRGRRVLSPDAPAIADAFNDVHAARANYLGSARGLGARTERVGLVGRNRRR